MPSTLSLESVGTCTVRYLHIYLPGTRYRNRFLLNYAPQRLAVFVSDIIFDYVTYPAGFTQISRAHKNFKESLFLSFSWDSRLLFYTIGDNLQTTS